MNEPTIALVFTPDPWVEEVHRHCTDHGGARVRQVLIDPALALEEQYDVLVVSHRWPALTHGLVDDVHDRGRKVLGVYDREEPAGRDFLRRVGVDGTVTSDAGPSGIVALLRALHGDSASDVSAADGADRDGVLRGGITVVSGPAGAGATEIAIALTASSSAGAVLIDADDVAPAIAARLGLPIEPNIRDAIDAVEYGERDDASWLGAPGAHGLAIIVGLPSAAAWAQVRPPEVVRLVQRVAAVAPRVVVDIAGPLEDVPVTTARPRHAVGRALLAEADDIVAVGTATPVGVTRLLAWIADARLLVAPSALHVVVNRAPKDAFRRGEVMDEIANAFTVASITVVPSDRRVDAAAWAGGLVHRGPFTRAVGELARRLGRHHARAQVAS